MIIIYILTIIPINRYSPLVSHCNSIIRLCNSRMFSIPTVSNDYNVYLVYSLYTNVV